MAGYLLALDLGSTFFKAAVFSSSLQRLAEAAEPVPYLTNTTIEVEMEAEALWQAARKVLLEACRHAGIEPGQVRDLAITSQAQTFAVFTPDGHPLTPFYSWLDKRATEEAAILAGLEQFHHHCSFPTAVAQHHSSKTLWLARHQPAVLRSGSLVWHLPTYIAWKLGASPFLDENLAAMGGLFSLQRGTWWKEALNTCDIEGAQLPELRPIGAAVEAPQSTLFPSGLRITLAGNDQTSGAYGNEGAAGSLIVTMGTALVLYRIGGRERGPFSPGGIWGPFPGGMYYELATRDEGCRALEWAREDKAPHLTTPQWLDEAARYHQAGRTSRVCFQPAAIGTPDAWEVPDGYRPDPAEWPLAVLHGINAAVLDLLTNELGAPSGAVREAVMIGGSAACDLWRQLLAAALGCTVRRGEGDSLLGAARLIARSDERREEERNEKGA